MNKTKYIDAYIPTQWSADYHSPANASIPITCTHAIWDAHGQDMLKYGCMAYADTCSHMLTYAYICQQVPAYASIEDHMRAHARICRHMSMYNKTILCEHMPARASTSLNAMPRPCWHQETTSSTGWHMLAQAGLCYHENMCSNRPASPWLRVAAPESLKSAPIIDNHADLYTSMSIHIKPIIPMYIYIAITWLHGQPRRNMPSCYLRDTWPGYADICAHSISWPMLAYAESRQWRSPEIYLHIWGYASHTLWVPAVGTKHFVSLLRHDLIKNMYEHAITHQAHYWRTQSNLANKSPSMLSLIQHTAGEHKRATTKTTMGAFCRPAGLACRWTGHVSWLRQQWSIDTYVHIYI